MNNRNTRKKRSSATKGERLNWSELKSVQALKLSNEVIVGKLVSKTELNSRSNSNAVKSNVLVP